MAQSFPVVTLLCYMSRFETSNLIWKRKTEMAGYESWFSPMDCFIYPKSCKQHNLPHCHCHIDHNSLPHLHTIFFVFARIYAQTEAKILHSE